MPEGLSMCATWRCTKVDDLVHARALSPALCSPTSHASALQAAQFRAMRCFFAAHGLLVTGKLPEAHALFGRAAQRASQASSLHEVSLAWQPAHWHASCPGNHHLAEIGIRHTRLSQKNEAVLTL